MLYLITFFFSGGSPPPDGDRPSPPPGQQFSVRRKQHGVCGGGWAGLYYLIILNENALFLITISLARSLRLGAICTRYKRGVARPEGSRHMAAS